MKELTYTLSLKNSRLNFDFSTEVWRCTSDINPHTLLLNWLRSCFLLITSVPKLASRTCCSPHHRSEPKFVLKGERLGCFCIVCPPRPLSALSLRLSRLPPNERRAQSAAAPLGRADKRRCNIFFGLRPAFVLLLWRITFDLPLLTVTVVSPEREANHDCSAAFDVYNFGSQ